MPKTLEQRTIANETLTLPVKRCSELSHLENVNYCIKKLGRISDTEIGYAVGYFTERTALGTRHTLHRAMPLDQAEELKRSNSRFGYVTLPEFLRRKEEIERGKYNLHDGQIVGFNPAYAGQ